MVVVMILVVMIRSSSSVLVVTVVVIFHRVQSVRGEVVLCGSGNFLNDLFRGRIHANQLPGSIWPVLAVQVVAIIGLLLPKLALGLLLLLLPLCR